jgi:hypothetical protein
MSQPLFKADRVTIAFAAQKGGSLHVTCNCLARPVVIRSRRGTFKPRLGDKRGGAHAPPS